MADLFADSEITRYLALETMSPAVALDFAADFIAGSEEEFADHGSGALAVTLREGGALIGYAGTRALPDRTRALELMYAIERGSWGQGYGTEAAAAVLDWAFETFADLQEVLAMVRQANSSSIRVLQHLAMEPRGRTERYYDMLLLLYAMTREAPARAKLKILSGVA